jgi:Holliday junction resolvasome RuvABC ATP-dependent DNA helicase subunit
MLWSAKGRARGRWLDRELHRWPRSSCSRSIRPRIANRLLRRVRDFAQVSEAPVVTREVAASAELIIASRPPK